MLDSVQRLVWGILLIADSTWAGEPVRLINLYASPDKGKCLNLFQALQTQLAATGGL